MRWSESVTLEFVKLYLKHECLWNPSHSDYKLKYARNKAYEDIISDFKIATNKTLTLIEVKMKIRALRTTYSQQVQKILQRSAPDSIYEPSLVWFNEMDQCLKHISPISRQSHSNDSSEMNPQQIWLNHELQNGSLGETTTDPIVSQTDDEFDTEKQKESESSNRKSKFRRNKKKKNKPRNSIDSTDSISEQNDIQEDEFDVYGKYIATQLRQMSIQRALRVQLEIQNLVSEARISEICNG
ncbi:uncharacterized protein LOC128675682 [Plodia interpunctella]|uniref:uncharacterized protein LOC128675682 n=1 Tax=Plodia interpunctella TaxID=58824 RepID=UPI002367B995|nr:uncharacterized protein LOC128675682 [Plodia interpunctella]